MTSIDISDVLVRLERLLHAQLPDAEKVTVTEGEQITGGFSAVTIKAKASIDGVTQKFVVRRDPPPGQRANTFDREREWAILRALTGVVSVPLPATRFYDDGTYFDSPTIVVDFVEGEPLLRTLQSASDEFADRAADDFADLIAMVHDTNVAALPADFGHPGSWDDHIDASIEGWRRAEEALPARDPFFRFVASWLDKHRPPPVPLCLDHGDIQAGNILVTPDADFVVVDWECAHIGDPREDLGWSWMMEALAPPAIVGRNIEAFCARYRKRTGLSEDQINPATLAYGALLGFGRMVGSSCGTISAAAEGNNRSIITAYSATSFPGIHSRWLSMIKISEEWQARR
ncbi:phosphotransferase family protein [Nocardia cyriacigeorgica]|uniref:phosphotransferase family protein n=1 Tax=Nocardia cyriacigeorgica TaxID=135487 RepID=UPI0013D8CBFF|nr:phosphotransferase family protein [Nocardia cyriacigeorgica]NEW27080.1 phosphotransferase family protein [Nocardia cyriacigeorgica]